MVEDKQAEKSADTAQADRKPPPDDDEAAAALKEAVAQQQASADPKPPPQDPQPDDEREPLPAELHEAMVQSVQTGIRSHGDAFIPAILTAVHEVVGLVSTDARRAAWLLAAARNPDDAYQRCLEVVTSMHGSDFERQAVVRRLREAIG